MLVSHLDISFGEMPIQILCPFLKIGAYISISSFYCQIILCCMDIPILFNYSLVDGHCKIFFVFIMENGGDISRVEK